jgi:predicted acetyltransferase
MVDTNFQNPAPLIDGDLTLVLRQTTNADSSMGLVPAYRFDMMLTPTGERVGSIDLRLGDSDFLIRYAGQIGYGVDLPFRGHHFAARSVRLIVPLAASHGMMPLWITCNPENWPSRRSCEIAGGTMVEIVDLPTDSEMYRRGERRKCRYRIDG